VAIRLDILNRLLLGQTAYHRNEEAWDVLGEDGTIVAVLCPRENHVSLSVPQVKRQPGGAGITPYRERVELKVTDTNLPDGIDRLRVLAGAP
jgi:hypothetical protein